MKALNRSNEVRHKLRTLLEAGYEEHWEVRRVLAKASNALSKQWLDGDFVTAAVAIHDAETGTLTYACAGHPAPLLMGVAHHKPVSACSSPALGWGLPTGRRQTTVLLGEHETACFFTDGLIEARIKGSFLGRDGLEDLFRGLGDTGTAKDLLHAVIARSHEAEDDLAALVLRPTTSVPSDTLRVEELEFSAADVRRKVPERFLAACDAPAEEIERLSAAARAATTDGRLAVLRVSFSAGGSVEATVVASGAPDPQSLVAA
jgi:Stage II sporulation protein E (SpoIIE)